MARIQVPIAVTDLAGNVVAGATVRVKKRSDGTDAVLYVAETGPTTTPNPTVADSAGRIAAWVDRGAYNATISGTGITTYTQAFEAAPAGDRTMDEPWMPAGSIPTLVSALPSGPADGQEIYYLVDAAAGIVWHLRYRAASASTYKWEFVGGPQLLTDVPTYANFSNTSYADLGGPNITVPLAGDYVVAFGYRPYKTDAGKMTVYMSFAIGATAAVDADAAQATLDQDTSVAIARERLKTGVAAGSVIGARFRAATGTWSPANAWIRVSPIRVG